MTVLLKLLGCEEHCEEFLFDLRVSRFRISEHARDVGDRLIILEQCSAETS